MNTLFSKKVRTAVLIVLIIVLLGIFLGMSAQEAGAAYEASGPRAAQPLYSDQCPETSYPRDLDEWITIPGTGKEYSVCYNFNDVRVETDIDTLVLKVGPRDQWAEFKATDYITSTQFGATTNYHLAMARELDSYKALPMYSEPGDSIFMFYTLATGHYAFRWYVRTETSCDILYFAKVTVGTGTYPTCSGLMYTVQVDDRMMIQVASETVFNQFDDSRSSLLYQYFNARWYTDAYHFVRAYTDLGEDQMSQLMLGEGLYFFYEYEEGKFDLIQYENTGPARQTFLSIIIK